jgi:predicted nuclease with TOPRIM domain
VVIRPDPALLREREQNKSEIARLTKANEALTAENNELHQQLNEQAAKQQATESELTKLKENNDRLYKEMEILKRQQERLLEVQKKAVAVYEERIAEIVSWKREAEQLGRKISVLEKRNRSG